MVSCHEITRRREYINDKINIEVLNDRWSVSLWIIKFVDNANISVTFSKYYSSICLFLVWKFSYEFNTDPNFAMFVLLNCVKRLNPKINTFNLSRNFKHLSFTSEIQCLDNWLNNENGEKLNKRDNNNFETILYTYTFEEGRKEERKFFVNICLVLDFPTNAPS